MFVRVSVITLIALLIMPISAAAFSAVLNELPEPYAVLTIEDIATPTSYYGKLDSYPDTYEFVLTEATDVSFGLYAYPPEEDVRFAGILVREQAGGGVKEIARLREDGVWPEVTDPETKIVYREGPSYRDTLPAGTYRFEVSNPDNVGQYKLEVGDGSDDAGYFASLGNIRAVYEFHDRSVLGMLQVPLVYLPLGILLLLGLIYLTIRHSKQRETTNPTTTATYDL